MRRPTAPAASIAGPALIALLLAPIATARQDAPPPAPAAEVQVTAPAAVPVPAPAPGAAPGQAATAATTETVEDQEQQDRQLADTLRDPSATGPADVTVRLPQGFVRIAIDVDNDGTFDVVETINAQLLAQVRRLSDPLQAQAGVTTPAMTEPATVVAEGDPASPQGPGEIQLSGTVQDVREFRLAGFPAPHRLARVETEQGVAKVDLGPADLLGDLAIAPGDEVTVVGHRGMINDRPVLMAREVSKGDQSAAVEAPEDGRIKRVRGELRSTRTVSFRDRDEDHLVAQVALRSGAVAEVILGPKDRIEGVDLTEGTPVSMLVRPARLNGHPVMAAEQLRIGDTTIAINEPVEGSVETDEGVAAPDADPAGGNPPAEAPPATDRPTLTPKLSDPAPDAPKR